MTERDEDGVVMSNGVARTYHDPRCVCSTTTQYWRHWCFLGVTQAASRALLTGVRASVGTRKERVRKFQIVQRHDGLINSNEDHVSYQIADRVSLSKKTR